MFSDEQHCLGSSLRQILHRGLALEVTRRVKTEHRTSRVTLTRREGRIQVFFQGCPWLYSLYTMDQNQPQTLLSH